MSDLKIALASVITEGDVDLQQRTERLTTLSDLFFKHYGDGPVFLLRAPARINVLGEHIDYVSYLPTASLTFGSRERDVFMLYRKSEEPVVECVSSSPQYEPSSFSISDSAIDKFGAEVEAEWLGFLFAHEKPEPHWRNYLEGAVTFARGKFGPEIHNGISLALDSNIPAGGGASSSSALVVLGGAAIRDVNGVSWTPAELAKDSAMAEWYIGTRGGSMDHTTICLAQPTSAVLINYAVGQTKRVRLPDQPFEWITFFSKPADKGREVMIEYNERAAVSRLLIPAIIDKWKTIAPAQHNEWEQILKPIAAGLIDSFKTAEALLLSLPETISIDSISADYPAAFSELQKSFPALLDETSRWPLKIRDRALHHLSEIKRVTLATRALESLENDENSSDTLQVMQNIGKLLDESHASLRDLYEVSVPEVEELLAVVRDDAHVLGARLMGGGFGGNILALTTRDQRDSLIERVQREYYAPRDRNGVREGSVMVSTPGPGLAEVDLNDLWRYSIVAINSLAPAASHAANLRRLIDAADVALDPRDIWPVIVAAGKGTRASETGLKTPKPIALVGDTPAIVHVLRNIRDGLGKTRPPVIIVSPDTEAAIREALQDEDVLFVTQPEPLGTGDAVLNTHPLLHDFTGRTLVVWSTQPVIREKTFALTAKLAQLFEVYDMVLPTAFVQRPYAPLQRNALGEIAASLETHLEAAQTIESGETNLGLFLVKNQKLFETLLDLRSRYWNDSTRRYDRSRGELGFPNEVISALAPRKHGVFAIPFADAREEQGIKRLEDLECCERFISELEQENDNDGK
ncbi:MAG TPA: galactokinase family protein [Pyrinomonadaceae bacterium]|nr:galactokinase family protein [Pyrinomonadaceae bacterium]